MKLAPRTNYFSHRSSNSDSRKASFQNDRFSASVATLESRSEICEPEFVESRSHKYRVSISDGKTTTEAFVYVSTDDNPVSDSVFYVGEDKTYSWVEFIQSPNRKTKVTITRIDGGLFPDETLILPKRYLASYPSISQDRKSITVDICNDMTAVYLDFENSEEDNSQKHALLIFSC